ncbi:uncharacterized protein LOC111313358 [Durio zibethinus]|uniref:Uncharacterized protein LOC111313358 n=1 Tax=Durio zibethinus TaxID=66656 RepID=A0A6P6AYA4_DURZI|nr:uncharacterized protein LOC111313358 [Durio zibethinus]
MPFTAHVTCSLNLSFTTKSSMQASSTISSLAPTASQNKTIKTTMLNTSTAKVTIKNLLPSTNTLYRMSFDQQRVLKRSDSEVLPRYNSSGLWKVKLVISPDQLAEILAQEARTEALIESVRTVAKCGNGVSSVANSDQWSTVSSSWKGSSETYAEDRW